MKKIVLVVALTILASCSTAPVSRGISTDGSTAEPATQSTGFSSILNSFRTSEGLGPLQSSASLTLAAQAHAEDMARRRYFSHQSPGGPNGNNFQERARTSGCSMNAGAENIATGQRTEEEVLLAWQNSPGHRRNMLVSKYKEYGLGRSGDIWVLKLAESC